MSDAPTWDGQSVTRMIAERRLDEASARVSETLAKTPSYLPAQLAQARILLGSGKADDAVALLSPIARDRPNNPWVSALLIDALIATGRLGHAQETLLSMPAPNDGEDKMIAAMLANFVQAMPSFDARIEFLERVVAHWPASQAALLKLAGQKFLVADGEAAVGILERAEDLGPLPAYGRRLREGLVMARGDHAAAVTFLQAQLAEDPSRRDTARRLIRALAAAGAFEEAAQHLIDALTRWPDEWLLLYRANRLFLSAERDEEVFQLLTQAANVAEHSDLWRLQYALFALRTGRADLAQTALATLDGTAAATIANATADALDELGAPGKARIGLDVSVDFDVVRVPDAVATVVVFGNLIGGVGHLPLYLIDPLLSDLPVNVIYLRDPYGLAYLRGVPSLGPDEAATADALAARVAELGAPRVVTTGSSISGYAATRYGLFIGADATVSFAGPIALQLDPAEENRATRQTALGMQELRAVAGGTGDLSAALEEAGERFFFTSVVGSQHEPDIKRVSGVRDFANVDVVTLPDVDHHFSALEAVADGTFMEVLGRVALGRQ